MQGQVNLFSMLHHSGDKIYCTPLGNHIMHILFRRYLGLVLILGYTPHARITINFFLSFEKVQIITPFANILKKNLKESHYII